MCIWATQYHLPQDRSALAEDSNIMIFETSTVTAQLPFQQVTFDTLCSHILDCVLVFSDGTGNQTGYDCTS